jgi:hypothetical protein
MMMCKRLVSLICLVLVLALVADVQAATVNWIGEGSDQPWSIPANWDSGALPTVADVVNIKTSPGPIVLNEGAVAKNLRIGTSGNDDATLTVDGGVLELDAWSAVGAWPATAKGTLNMKSGTFNCKNELVVGNQGAGIVDMIGGTLMVTFNLKIGREATGVGHVDLRGGIITANNLLMREEAGSVGTMDVGGGTLILNGNDLATVQGYVDKGWITAYGGYGTIQLGYDETKDTTTLEAIHNLKPNPAHRSIVEPGDVELSWTLPDPCDPGQPVLVDVYITDDLDQLLDFTDPESMMVLSQQNATSVVVPTQIKTGYYWTVDTYVGSDNDPILGPVFNFIADNAPPLVNAGPDINTILQEGTRSGLIRGTVTDDGQIQPFTVTWTVLEQPSDADPTLPSAVIADPTALETTVTVSAEGTYLLQLEANDGEYANSDTMAIFVNPDDWRE